MPTALLTQMTWAGPALANGVFVLGCASKGNIESSDISGDDQRLMSSCLFPAVLYICDDTLEIDYKTRQAFKFYYSLILFELVIGQRRFSVQISIE